MFSSLHNEIIGFAKVLLFSKGHNRFGRLLIKVQTMRKIEQSFVAFSEKLNFKLVEVVAINFELQ